MTDDQRNKISEFIDNLLEYKLDKINFDHFISKKKEYYSMEIDSGVPLSPTGCFRFSFGNQMIYFSICKDGNITLSREEMFSDNDIILADKYFDILRNLYIKKQNKIIDSIIDTSYTDLNLRREVNIGKLI